MKKLLKETSQEVSSTFVSYEMAWINKLQKMTITFQKTDNTHILSRFFEIQH